MKRNTILIEKDVELKITTCNMKNSGYVFGSNEYFTSVFLHIRNVDDRDKFDALMEGNTVICDVYEGLRGYVGRNIKIIQSGFRNKEL